MPQLLDIKAFLVTARTGSFSAAAREIGLAASVVTKRVSRLEEQIGSALFQRTTRRLTLTSEGERLRPRLQLLIAEIDEALRSARVPEGGVAGQLRVKSPTTVGMLYVGGALARFQARNPRVKIELLLVDRAVNPLEEGFDVALGGLPVSFSGVLDLPLCQYDRVLVAAPAYLADNPAPRSPNDLVAHDCLAFLPIGLEWSFESDQGAIVVEIRARFTANDSQVLLTAALEGLRHHGGAALPRPRSACGGPAGRRAGRLSAAAAVVQGDGAAEQGEQARGGGAGRAPEGRVRARFRPGIAEFPNSGRQCGTARAGAILPYNPAAAGGGIACRSARPAARPRRSARPTRRASRCAAATSAAT